MGTISPWQYLHFALQFPKNGDCLPFSSFQLKVFFHLKKIEVVFDFVYHISSSWVKRRLHTENLLHGLPGSASKFSVVGGGGFHCIMWSHQLRFWVEVGL
jgi:hypothetical protein